VGFVTTSTEEEAARIGRSLVEQGLAACANIVPAIRSIYRWEGKTVDDREFLVLLKTRPELFEKLQAVVKGLHSYKTPEIIAIEVKHGSAEYLGWIDAETSKALKLL
jgi:periplasmic divalent cation tolerance protein